jgi:hypothetical protein
MGEHPYYRFFRRISFDLDRRLWERMPRHPCFKHEYWNGRLHWTPRPNTCDVVLDLDHWQPPAGGRTAPPPQQEPVAVRSLQEQDWQKLPDVFCAASGHWPPWPAPS